jgi:peptidoglycan/xylan/chitin deacetylase (PgdA/CDA1 family)
VRSIYIKINNLLKEIAAWFIRYSGIPFLIRNTYAKKRVSIIVYHDPEPDVLDKHLSYLSKKYNFISLECLVNAIYSKNWANIPQRGLVITLDDGHKGNFNLLEVFKKYNIVPTIYLCIQIVNTNRHFWFRVKSINANSLKKFTNEKRLELLQKKFGFTPTKEYPEKERQALNKKEIKLMKDHVDFQAHSLFHPILTTCTDSECEKEIFQSKKDIEALLGIECKHFAYPNGDYTDREIELVKKAGYISARTIDVGWNDSNTDPYRLKARMVTDNASINLLDAQLSGVTQYLRYLIRGSFTGKYPTVKLKGNNKIND